MIDLSSRVSILYSLKPQTLAEGAGVAGVAIDTRGFHSVTAVLSLGTVADSFSAAPALEESDDGSTGWAAIPAARLIGGALPTMNGTNDEATHKRGIKGSTKRFVRLSTGTATGGGAGALPVAGLFVLGKHVTEPVA